jgi:hypothetical protein
VYVLQIVVCPFVYFVLAIVLSVLGLTFKLFSGNIYCHILCEDAVAAALHFNGRRRKI